MTVLLLSPALIAVPTLLLVPSLHRHAAATKPEEPDSRLLAVCRRRSPTGGGSAAAAHLRQRVHTRSANQGSRRRTARRWITDCACACDPQPPTPIALAQREALRGVRAAYGHRPATRRPGGDTRAGGQQPRRVLRPLQRATRRRMPRPHLDPGWRVLAQVVRRAAIEAARTDVRARAARVGAAWSACSARRRRAA